MERDNEISVVDWRQLVEQTQKEILKCEFKEDLEKEVSYLINCVQQYCRKGGKKDLW